MQKTVEEKYDLHKRAFCKLTMKEIDKTITSNTVKTFIYGVLSVVEASSVDTIGASKKSILQAIKSYTSFKKPNLKSLRDAVRVNNSPEAKKQLKDARDAVISIERNLAQPGLSRAVRAQLNRDLNQAHKTKDSLFDAREHTATNATTLHGDFLRADKIIKKIEHFVNSERGGNKKTIGSLEAENKKAKRKQTGKDILLGGLSAMTGSAIPSMLPDLIKDAKSGYKDFKANTKGGKAKTIAGLGFSALGGLFQSSAMMTIGSHFKQGANSDLAKVKKVNKEMETFRKSLFRSKSSEFSSDNLAGDPSKLGGGTARNVRNPETEAIWKALKNAGIDIGNRRTMLAKGGNFITKGRTAIGSNFMAGEAGAERITVTPLKDDPIVKQLKIANIYLDKLTTANQEMYEDQAEATRLAGLNSKNKKDEKEKTNFLKSLFKKQGSTGTDGTDGLGSGFLSKYGAGIAMLLAPVIAGVLTSFGLKNSSGTSFRLPESERYNNNEVMGGGNHGKTKAGSMRDSAMEAVIRDAALKTGQDPDRMIEQARKESGLNPDVPNGKGSNAKGLFQMMPDTWTGVLKKHGKKHGLDEKTPVTDPRANALMAGELAKDDENILKTNRIPITNGTRHMMHILGGGDGPSFLKANPNTLAPDALVSKNKNKILKQNSAVFYHDGDRMQSPKTVAEVLQWANSESGQSKSSAVSTPSEPTSAPPLSKKTIGSSSSPSAIQTSAMSNPDVGTQLKAREQLTTAQIENANKMAQQQNSHQAPVVVQTSSPATTKRVSTMDNSRPTNLAKRY